MTGRHPRPRNKLDTRRVVAGAAGAVGAAALALPLAPTAALAGTLDPGPVPPGNLPTLPGGSHGSRGERVVDAASEEYGRPYMWGGDGPVVFDCWTDDYVVGRP